MLDYDEWVENFSDDMHAYMRELGFTYGDYYDAEFDRLCEKEYAKYCREYQLRFSVVG